MASISYHCLAMRWTSPSLCQSVLSWSMSAPIQIIIEPPSCTQGSVSRWYKPWDWFLLPKRAAPSLTALGERWSVASTNAVRHLLIQHEDNSTSRQFNKKQLNKIQLNYLPTGHIAIQQLLFQQHPSLNFRTTQQMQPPCSGKIRMSFQVQIWLANSKISCKIA